MGALKCQPQARRPEAKPLLHCMRWYDNNEMGEPT